ncbi:thrombospondin type 3 repeat-containing protein [Gammaproteobacteria bacterium]|nr:thrombospondin type 3 repeat-containing protein [Gammaproteobacteria bacterium]
MSFALLLWGCGGGGSSNSPPTSVSISKTSVLEGIKGATIGTLTTVDPDGGSFSYTISGADASSFAISGSSLRLASDLAADYETQTDYSISIRSADTGGLSVSDSFTILVVDAIEGRVVDAPLQGSDVFIDLDGDLVQDSDEPTGTSDANGFFAVENLAGSGSPKIISVGGTDTKTGKALPNLALMSDLPSDASKSMAVTPITTLVAVAETPAAKAKVLTALGVTGTVEELLTTDNWAEAEAGDASAKELQRKNQQVGLILQTAESLVDSDAATKATDVTQAVAKQLVEETSASESVDLTHASTISEVLTDAVAEVAPEVSVATETIAAVSGSVSEVNTLVGDSQLDPTGDANAEILEAAQTTLQSSVEELAAGTVDVAAFETATESKALFEGSTVLEALPDADDDGLADAVDLDDDADGVADTADAFPLDKNESLDTDTDGTGNNADTDDDGDGVLDTADAFPLDKSESLDTDSDGIGNNTDTDDDGDGVLDTADAFPLASLGSLTDTDGNGAPDDCDSACATAGMTADNDDDGDGVLDSEDNYPLIGLGELLDTDSDGSPNDCDDACIKLGMMADADDDADGISDSEDVAPLDDSRPPPLFWDAGDWGEVKWQ